mgnify:CR=1 FL=1
MNSERTPLEHLNLNEPLPENTQRLLENSEHNNLLIRDICEASEIELWQENADSSLFSVAIATGSLVTADSILFEKGVVVIPDILANSGGVTVSYFEWDQNVKGEHWSEEDVLEKLEKIMVNAFDEVWETKEKYSIDMRTAAFVKAVERVAEKTEI